MDTTTTTMECNTIMDGKDEPLIVNLSATDFNSRNKLWNYDRRAVRMSSNPRDNSVHDL